MIDMTIFRILLSVFALTCLAVGPGVVTAEVLAKTDARMPTDTPYESAQTQNVSKVIVRKQERRLYLMDGNNMVRSYRISLGDNPDGHKLYEGDERTPEGDYILDWRNDQSDFYKSIHISYPSEQDRALASAWGLDPGGSIMIHGLPNGVGDLAFAYTGLDWTDGCIAVNNEEMDEIWQLVSDGTPISIFP